MNKVKKEMLEGEDTLQTMKMDRAKMNLDRSEMKMDRKMEQKKSGIYLDRVDGKLPKDRVGIHYDRMEMDRPKMMQDPKKK